MCAVYGFGVRCWEYFKEPQVANSPGSSSRTRRIRVYVQLGRLVLWDITEPSFNQFSGPRMSWTLDILTCKLSSIKALVRYGH